MSPTRRDLFRSSVGMVAAAVTVSAVGCRIVEPVAAEPEPEPVTWEMTAPVILDGSDGQRWRFLTGSDSAIVNVYREASDYQDHETIRFIGDEARELHQSLSAVACGIARLLAAAGVE